LNLILFKNYIINLENEYFVVLYCIITPRNFAHLVQNTCLYLCRGCVFLSHFSRTAWPVAI